jgi:site-specific recombinase XerD
MPQNLPDLADLLPSWRRAMVPNKSPATVTLYTGSVETFLRWCEANAVAPELTRDTVNAFIGDILAGGAAGSTAVARQKALRQYAKWLTAEGELPADPLIGLVRPAQQIQVVESLDDDALRRLFAACQGTGFLERRDEAALRLFAETGVRAGELLGLAVADVDLDRGEVVVRKPKGGEQRRVYVGAATVAALDRYVRMRRRAAQTGVTAMWVGVRGTALTYSGLNDALRGRAKAAGVTGFHLHLLRHTAATRWLRKGGSEQGLMAVAGWRSREQLDRYTAASMLERAKAEAQRLKLGDL